MQRELLGGAWSDLKNRKMHHFGTFDATKRGTIFSHKTLLLEAKHLNLEGEASTQRFKAWIRFASNLHGHGGTA
jgi:hypothetical protein